MVPVPVENGMFPHRSLWSAIACVPAVCGVFPHKIPLLLLLLPYFSLFYFLGDIFPKKELDYEIYL